MNANEFIDELWVCLESSIIRDSDTRDLIMEAATMLRNLQDRIERQAGEYESLVRIKENLQAEKEALKKEAALQRLSDFTQEAAKTLTDEEIKQVMVSAIEEQSRQSYKDIFQVFARAILRKAQEK